MTTKHQSFPINMKLDLTDIKIGRVGMLYQKQKSILNVSHKGARIFPD